jgi:hypothetical protein
VIPGDEPKPYERGNDAKQIVEDAERELQSWETDYEHVETKAEHGAAAVPMSTSLPSSQEERGHRASESQATESLEEQQEDTQADATSVSDAYSRISANDAASPTRIHSISAPRMYAGAFETAPVVNREEGVRKENERIGGEVKLKTLAPHDTQGIMSPGSDADFPIRTKQSELGSPLDSQVQRVAVPI